MNMGRPANPMNIARPNRQITMSPYFGAPDFSSLVDGRNVGSALDRVSIADLLRNGFVYAPHSIFENLKLATFGFDPQCDLHGDMSFRFPFPDSGKGKLPPSTGEDLVQTYHRLLCDALSRSCRDMRSPWLLQSGGKDSTSLAIAAADTRPDTICITYLGGREENEIASARSVARALGLKHEEDARGRVPPQREIPGRIRTGRPIQAAARRRRLRRCGGNHPLEPLRNPIAAIHRNHPQRHDIQSRQSVIQIFSGKPASAGLSRLTCTGQIVSVDPAPLGT